jgi:nucleotide-binding universal stress UspA family protein
MSYKTILVHLSDSRRAEKILAPAMRLAERHNSHLIGLHAHAVVHAPPVPMPYASGAVAKLAGQVRANAEGIAETFSRMSKGQMFVSEWQLHSVPMTDLAADVMSSGRAADLIVAGQTDGTWDLSPLFDFPERLALESGRPVLVIPHSGSHVNVGRNVVIAWKAGRESARAVFDALPLLKDAANVHILEFTETQESQRRLAADTSIAAALGRHGIKPVIHSIAAPGVRALAPDTSVGEQILSRLVDLDADLLVMGAYGHSRMREMIFGGVTRHLMREMTVPTLFSH